jgi:hypothetical protein
LRVQTSRATDQDKITHGLARLRPLMNHGQPIAWDFCGLAGRSLAGR